MTGKDIVKILLCQYGYDRNIEVTTYYGDYGAPGYEIRAEHVLQVVTESYGRLRGVTGKSEKGRNLSYGQ